MVPILAAALIVAVFVATAVHLSRARPAPARAGAGSRSANQVQTQTASTAAPTIGGPYGRVIGFLRRHRWFRRSLSVASLVIMGIAVWVVGYPFYTNLVQSRIQSRLDRQLASPELRQAYLDRRIEVGDSLTRIKIPRLGVDVVVVEGTTANALRAGAGHYVSTPLPCETGNVSIAGHRTTYGRPFNNVDLLRVGDVIILETPIGSCTYEVSQRPFVTVPTDLTVIANSPEAELTLTTCHPKGSARERLIVNATMVSSEIVQT